jgi:hypothetical protein
MEVTMKTYPKATAGTKGQCGSAQVSTALPKKPVKKNKPKPKAQGG